MAGASQILAVDPSPFNREQAKKFGATHTFASAAEARRRCRTSPGVGWPTRP